MICTDCKKDKPLTEFYIRKSNGRPRKQCKRCHFLRSQTVWLPTQKTLDNRKAYQKKNKEAFLANWRRHRKRHVFRYMARIANQRTQGEVTPFMLFCLAKYQKLLCPLTGRKLTKDNISLDHIIPISKGGTNSFSNLQLVDIQANRAKHVLSLEELKTLCQQILCQLSK